MTNHDHTDYLGELETENADLREKLAFWEEVMTSSDAEVMRERNELRDKLAEAKVTIQLLQSPRCEVCNGELSACGNMTEDGPADDCEVCQLQERLAAAEADSRRLDWYFRAYETDHIEIWARSDGSAVLQDLRRNNDDDNYCRVFACARAAIDAAMGEGEGEND